MLFILLCITNVVLAQSVVMKNGIVYLNGNTYCLYSEAGNKINTLSFPGTGFSQLLTPEESDMPFRDVTIKSPSNESLIFITAKVLSSPLFARLVYYYKVEFAGLDTVLNIPLRPNFTENFINSLIKYHVVDSGSINPDGADKLIAFWNKKPYAFGKNSFSYSSSCNYNTSPFNIEKTRYTDSAYIYIKGDSIFLNNQLFGYYHLSKNLLATALPGNSKNSYYYFIESANNSPLAEFQVNNRAPEILFWPEGYKTPIKLYTAVRDECHLVWEVTNALINENNKRGYGLNNK